MMYEFEELEISPINSSYSWLATGKVNVTDWVITDGFPALLYNGGKNVPEPEEPPEAEIIRFNIEDLTTSLYNDNNAIYEDTEIPNVSRPLKQKITDALDWDSIKERVLETC